MTAAKPELLTLKNNVVALAKAAKLFGVPTSLTTVETDSFSGHMIPELLRVFPDQDVLERTSMNSFDDANVREAMARAGPRKVVVSGLWTGICNNMFAFSAMEEEGYEICMVEDASGDTSAMAHDAASRQTISSSRSAMRRVARSTSDESRHARSASGTCATRGRGRSGALMVRSCGSVGLLRRSVAPAASASIRAPRSLPAVIATTGRAACLGSRGNARERSMPVMPGIRSSTGIRSETSRRARPARPAGSGRGRARAR